MTEDEKQQIVDVLNRKFRTDVAVEVIEAAVMWGFTTWEALSADAMDRDPNVASIDLSKATEAREIRSDGTTVRMSPWQPIDDYLKKR